MTVGLNFQAEIRRHCHGDCLALIQRDSGPENSAPLSRDSHVEFRAEIRRDCHDLL